MREIWMKYQKWLCIMLALLLVAIVAAAAASAAEAETVTVAEAPSETEITFDLEKNPVYAAEDGVIVIPASTTPMAAGDLAVKPAAAVITDSPEELWQQDVVTGSRSYTLPEQAQLADGSIGQLLIPKLGLAVGVYESDSEMEAMTHGLARFKTTSAWDGNIGLCGHNQNFDLTDGYFKQLHTLVKGDTISYKTALGERSYIVETVAEIAASDWSYLGRTEDNCITMITCISGKPNARLVVQAVEKS